ncbi:MAG: hypothetical protein JO266_12580, partial [Acidobacteria bacterium]|nr:hypothetical protein [Acidobacteriota bacterium]
LRTTFRFESGQPVEIVARSLTIPLPVSEVAARDGKAPLDVALGQAIQEYRRPFELDTGPLLRAHLWKIAEEEHLLLLVMHHIVSDGWSGGILFQELGAVYEAFCAGRQSPLPELPVQYVDFAVWQRAAMERLVDQDLAYWRERLAGAPTTLELPTDHPRPREASFRGRLRSLLLSERLSRRVLAFGPAQGATLFTVMLVGLEILLQRWTGQEDLVLGTVTANRNTREIEKLIGCFMNFLALREHVDGQECALSLLNRAKATVLEAFAHQDCPFEKVVETVNPQRASDVNPLYNVALLLQNYPGLAFQSSGIEARLIPLDIQVAFLDIRFIATATQAGILLEAECKADLFDEPTVDLLLTAYRDVLEQLVTEPERKIADFRIPESLTRQAYEHLGNRQSVVIASTFTAEPLRDTLSFWMSRLGIAGKISFAPYNQVFQQLLDPSSLFASNHQGSNVILMRIEDLVASEHLNCQHALEQLRAPVVEFMNAALAAAERSATPFLLCVCPPSVLVRRHRELANAFDQAQALLVAGLREASGISVVTWSELLVLYPVTSYDDEYAWQVGRVPYTPPLFTALATIIARRLYVLLSRPYLVIVLDCDHTLWRGDCREQGPLGVEIDEPRRVLQEFLLGQREAGRILCLYSKRPKQYVAEVFGKNPGMRLGWEHITSSRFGERPASEQVTQLAQELGLDLASFIFLSNNRLETAEMRRNCPQVTVAELPSNSARSAAH